MGRPRISDELKRERKLAYGRAYRARLRSSNTEGVRAYKRAWQKHWYSQNQEIAREKGRNHYAKNRASIRESAKQRYAALRDLIHNIKMSSGCIDCGFKGHPQALEFDHLPQYEKKFRISAGLTNKSKTDILAEIAKCEVRCANCHAIKTALRRLDA